MNKKGRLMIYCAECNKYYLMNDEQYNGVCPKCGALLLRMRCTRCGYMWSVRDPRSLPKICANPKCKSPYFCRERVLDKETGKLIPVDRRKKVKQ